jgi:hypothetical protein
MELIKPAGNILLGRPRRRSEDSIKMDRKAIVVHTDYVELL